MTDGTSPKLNVVKELRRLVREALSEQGGSGGRRECRYCLRESFRGQPEHYRVGVKSKDGICEGADEADEHCEVTVMRAAIKALTKRKHR